MEWIFIAIFIAPLLTALIAGRLIASSHRRSIEAREADYRSRISVTNLRQPPEGVKVLDSTLVTGSVILAADKFAAAVAHLKKIVGGHIGTIGRVVERARREALLRAIEEALEFGADTLINVRLETSTVFRTKGNKGSPLVEILVYATALKTE